MLRRLSEQFIRVCHISQERRRRQVRDFAYASREVSAADCAADGDPRELLQRQRAGKEAMNKSPHNANFRLPQAVINFPVVEYPARHMELLVANWQVARVQLAAPKAESQKLIRNANATFRPNED